MTTAAGARAARVGRWAAAVAIAVAAWAGLTLSSSDAAELGVSQEQADVVVVVGEGDTLWDLVLPYAPAGADAHEWVARVAAANDVEPLGLRPGDVLRVPIG